jgi:hypothetical protein
VLQCIYNNLVLFMLLARSVCTLLQVTFNTLNLTLRLKEILQYFVSLRCHKQFDPIIVMIVQDYHLLGGAGYSYMYYSIPLHQNTLHFETSN